MLTDQKTLEFPTFNGFVFALSICLATSKTPTAPVKAPLPQHST